MWVMKLKDFWLSASISTRDLEEPSEAPDFARKALMSPAASAVWTAPSACFFVQPAPATKRSFAPGRIVDSPPMPAAWRPFTVVRVGAAAALSSVLSVTPSFAVISAKSAGSVRSTHGRAARENVVRMRWR